jgi:uncharacterized repeat protein (TIGR01451 family)/MYXO-CTERM domain-containing protein
MNGRQWGAALGLGIGLGIAPGPATAAPALRLQVDQHGDMLLIGNTLGQDCAATTPAPLAGVVGPCGSLGIDDSAPDVFWRADEPTPGAALASSALTIADARSSAVLSLPPGATVTHALLYWGGRRSQPVGDAQATIEREGVFTEDVTAIASQTATVGTLHFYQSVADVSNLVAMYGSGSYRIAGVDTSNVVDVNLNSNYAGWWLVVFYDLPTDPFRSLAIFDGMDTVNDMSPQLATLSGFFVPGSGHDAKLGVVAYEGDASVSGDRLLANGSVLGDGENPATNFFNSTRSALGAPAGAPGDLPRLTGEAYSMSGLDYDVVDIAPQVQAGDSSLALQAIATGDQFFLGAFVTSITTLAPNFGASTKTAVDLDGGALLAGDTVEYSIVVTNNGNDDSIGTVLTDALPAGVTYVPDSIEITAGPNPGVKTDAFSDDQADYDSMSRTVIVRLGQGADASQAGSLLVGASTTVVFRVTVDTGASGILSNQAKITAGGMQGAPPSDDPTDGNGSGLGAPPTDIAIDACGSDTDCPPATPLCDTASSPTACVQCFSDSDCNGPAPMCDLMTKLCTCQPTGMEVCDGLDNDCNGTVDDGLLCADTDGDGLVDETENMVGTSLNDADSDDDGVTDGAEPDYAGDTDGDGFVNAVDSDSDNDGLFDGMELGLDCSHPDTDLDRAECRADADGGATKTDPLVADTDGGGISDGKEDANKNGRIDSGETDPNDAADDSVGRCQADSECGGSNSGKVCDDVTKTCEEGCREPARACPSGKLCTASEGFSGVCVNDNAKLSQDSGCQCTTPAEGRSTVAGWLGFIALGALGAMRRHRRSPPGSPGRPEGLRPRLLALIGSSSS